MEDQQVLSNVNTASQPSALKITDMRIVRTQTGGPIFETRHEPRHPWSR